MRVNRSSGRDADVEEGDVSSASRPLLASTTPRERHPYSLHHSGANANANSVDGHLADSEDNKKDATSFQKTSVAGNSGPGGVTSPILGSGVSASSPSNVNPYQYFHNSHLQHASAKSVFKRSSNLAAVLPSSLVSGIFYCLSSCSMILLNKVVLSGYKWEAQISLMLYQNLVSVTLVILLSRFGFIHTEPLTLRLLMVWMPVNLIFVGMLVTSFFSLQYMQVAMVTILKNVTNLITAVGEMYLFRKRHSTKVWGSLMLMIVSAICGGFTDLSFNPVGYTWQLFNCLFTAGYSLTLRQVMDSAKSATKSNSLNEFSMVLLNNSLSLPLALSLIVFFGEMHYVLRSPLLLDRGFWLACTLSGVLGLAISFTSMWFLHETSPTTYSLVGSLNKIPLSILGIVLFKAPTSVSNVASILFGCFAGVLFAKAKMASR